LCLKNGSYEGQFLILLEDCSLVSPMGAAVKARL
jgi:hypothetical protein